MYVTRSSEPMESVVGELEGALIKDPDPFPYLMLVAFEASGPIRFASLLLAWPLVRFLGLLGLGNAGFKLAVFIAVFGVRISEIEYVGRSVMPKFYMDHIDMDAWRVFSQYGKRVVVSKSPRVMLEWFAKEHLGAHQVIGSELVVNRFGRATGLLRDVSISSSHFEKLFDGKSPCVGLGRQTIGYHFDCSSILSFCEEKCHEPFSPIHLSEDQQDKHLKHPVPVVFHDGRLVMFPKPTTALLLLLWLPMGAILAIIRILLLCVLPVFLLPNQNYLYGIFLTVKGNSPSSKRLLPPHNQSASSGVLFVCNHRTFSDVPILAVALGRKISTVGYSVSRISEFLSPIPSVRLTRNRHEDAKIIEEQLKRGDVGICAEGTTCREPFLLRFSALFAELTDQIVPVAINYKPTFFHPTTARGWKGFDPIFYLMNPISFYEVTFLDQLPVADTCSGGKSSYDVANNVQQLVAATLGFQCTNFTRKDKYMLLKGDDGRV